MLSRGKLARATATVCHQHRHPFHARMLGHVGGRLGGDRSIRSGASPSSPSTDTLICSRFVGLKRSLSSGAYNSAGPSRVTPNLVAENEITRPFDPPTHAVFKGDGGGDAVRDDWSRLEIETRRLLDLMSAFSSGGDTDAVGEELSRTKQADFDRVINGWSKTVEEGHGVMAAERAETLLDALETNHDRLLMIEEESLGDGVTGNLTSNRHLRSLIPSIASYNCVLHAWAVSGGGADAAERAQAIVERMLRRCRNYSSGRGNCGLGRNGDDIVPPSEPSTISLNSSINAWAKSGVRNAGDKAEEVFRTIELWTHDCEKRRESIAGGAIYHGCKANSRSFSGIVDAWANSRAGSSGADRVETILGLFVKKSNPDVIFFNSVINAIAKSGQGSRGAEMAEGVLRTMQDLHQSNESSRGSDQFDLKPNTRTLSLIMKCWANSAAEGENPLFAARRAEEILTRMEELYKGGSDVKPNVVSFTTCITAWARCRRFQGAAEHAEEILNRMLKMYESSGDEEVKPTTSTFNSVISAWARSGRSDGAERAEAVLNRLDDFGTPDTVSYNAVIDSFSKSHGRGGGRKAVLLLERMESSGVKPDLVTYNTTIDALSKDGADDSAHRADLLLQKMEDLADDCTSGVDNFSFTSCINAYSRSADPHKAKKARNVLQRLIDRSASGKQDVYPDVFSYSACINACANTNGNQSEKRDALRIAIQTFEDFKRSNDGKPNAFTYGAMLKACSRLSSDNTERGRLMGNMFDECSREGFVSQKNFDLFRRNAPYGIRDSLLGDKGGLVPPQWCRHVRDSDRPSRFKR